MGIIYKEIPDERTIELVISDKITYSEFDKIAPRLKEFIEKNHNIKILEIIKNIQEAELVFPSNGFNYKSINLKNISHHVTVCNLDWISPLSMALLDVVSIKSNSFPSGKEDDANAWLKQEINN